jgi:hypothetical protein
MQARGAESLQRRHVGGGLRRIKAALVAIRYGAREPHEEGPMTTCACVNCQFYDTKSSAAANVTETDAGLCRFYPPLAQPGAHSLAAWPVVKQEDWCGHFAATVERFMTAA